MFDRAATDKNAKTLTGAIFARFSMGLQPKCDEWIYDKHVSDLKNKMKYFTSAFNAAVKNKQFPNDQMKWHRELVKLAQKTTHLDFDPRRIVKSIYRPFSIEDFYNDPRIISMNFLQQKIFAEENKSIAVSGVGSNKPFACLAIAVLPSHDLLEKAQTAPFNFFVEGRRADNITDWALEQFRLRYEAKSNQSRSITKRAVFQYVYGVLHDPAYREKYARNLKREFPRIPFYRDFWRWADWGHELMALHIGYEAAKASPLKRIDTHDEKSKEAGLAPKAILKANKDTGVIQLDSETELTGVPLKAWDYKLGTRSALEWVLDQYKEKTSSDPVIREKFDTYRFADHKEKVIDLLKRITHVSVETVKIVEAMDVEKH